MSIRMRTRPYSGQGTPHSPGQLFLFPLICPIWAKSRSRRIYVMPLNIGECPNCTGMFVLFIPALIKLHLHMYHEKLWHSENNCRLSKFCEHVTEGTVCSFITNLITFLLQWIHLQYCKKSLSWRSNCLEECKVNFVAFTFSLKYPTSLQRIN